MQKIARVNQLCLLQQKGNKKVALQSAAQVQPHYLGETTFHWIVDTADSSKRLGSTSQ